MVAEISVASPGLGPPALVLPPRCTPTRSSMLINPPKRGSHRGACWAEEPVQNHSAWLFCPRWVFGSGDVLVRLWPWLHPVSPPWWESGLVWRENAASSERERWSSAAASIRGGLKYQDVKWGEDPQEHNSPTRSQSREKAAELRKNHEVYANIARFISLWWRF